MSTATPTRTHDDADAGRREAIGLFLGFLGVVMFGGTLPFTKLAVGELSPWFITIGRAAAAGLLALATIALTRAPRPKRVDILPLVVSGAFLIIGFPALMTTALKQVPAIHGAIVIGVLPLATVVAYALTRGGLAGHVHDLLLLGSVACAASGYAIAGRLSRQMRGWAVISWSLVLLLPVNLPLAVWLAPADPGAVSASAWTGFAYVSVFSMFLGFFAWNAGLAMGGVARVSQTQLLQTFVSLAIAVPLLGERLDAHALFFASAVVVIVFLGRRARVG